MLNVIPNANARTDSAEYRAWKMMVARQDANRFMDNLIQNARNYRRGLVSRQEAKELGQEASYFLVFSFYRLYSAMKYRTE
jgi:hypothetical protein